MKRKNMSLFILSLVILFSMFSVVSAATGISVTSPNGGEYLKDGSSIAWSVTNGVSTDRFDIRYSNDGGSNWVTIASRLYYSARSYAWDTLSVSDGFNYLIQVVESATSSADDVSNNIFAVDNTAPTSSATSLTTYQNAATFNIPFTITDANPGSVELFYSTNGGSSWTSSGTSTSSPISFTASGDGNYKFYTIATDLAGNIESKSATIESSTTVDTTNPSVTINSVTTPTNTTTQTITGTFTEINMGTISVNGVNANIVSGTYSATIPLTIEGANTITATATDLAGNTGTASTSIFLDTATPTTSDNYASNDVWVNSDQTITLTPADNSPSSGIEWTKYCLTSSCDPASGTIYSTSVTISNEGTNYFRYASKDKAGNIQITQEKIIKIDKTNPAVPSNTLTYPNGGNIFAGGNRETITWNSGGITETNLNSSSVVLKYSTDGSTWNSIATGEENGGSYLWNVPSVDSTNVKVRISVSDLAGNSASDESDSVFTIDSITPSITTYTIDNSTISPNGDGINDGVSMDLEFSEEVSQAKIEIINSSNNLIKEIYSNTAPVTNPQPKIWNGTYSNGTVVPDGVYTINVSITDPARHTYTDTSKTITVESGVIYVGVGYTTIQSAINAANPGDIIKVNSGTYIENININKGLTLQSVSGAIATIISGTATGNIITISADNVVVNGFNITNGNILGVGIYSSDYGNLTITNNIINAIGNSANDISGRGIEVISSSANVDNISITNNQINNITSGLKTAGNSKSASGISIGWSTGNYNITNLVIQNNVISNINADTSPWGSTKGQGAYGILINHGTNGIAKTVGAQILNNQITDLEGLWAHGIGLEGDTPNAVVTGNIISNLIDHKGGTDAIAIFAEANPSISTITLAQNNMSNSALGVALHPDLAITTAGVLDASNNWWGDSTGPNSTTSNSGGLGVAVWPSVDDSRTSYINFYPWAEDTTFTRFYAPVLTTIGNKSVNEGSTLTFTITASDTDTGDSLTYSANNLPTGANFNVNTQEFTWTPTNDSVSNNIEFKVTDGFIETSETINITVNNVAPVVNAGADQTVNEGYLVNFGATATDVGSDTLTYNWNFGDSNTGTGQSPTHTYADNGIYTVTLIVNDGTTNVIDTLTVIANNVAPTASATSNTTSGVINDVISFTGSQTDPGTNDTFTYLWNFGDGQTSTSQNPTHSYNTKGDYTANLTVTDDNGGNNTSSNIEIKVNDMIWDLSNSWNLVSVPKNLVKNNTATLLPSNDIWEYDGSSWINPTTINPGIGYWVDNASLTSLGLDYSGDCTGPSCLPSGNVNIDALKNGWNLIGLTTTNTTKTVGEAFSSQIFNNQNLPVFNVISYDKTADEFVFLNSTDVMNPGEGYWVYMVQ